MAKMNRILIDLRMAILLGALSITINCAGGASKTETPGAGGAKKTQVPATTAQKNSSTSVIYLSPSGDDAQTSLSWGEANSSLKQAMAKALALGKKSSSIIIAMKAGNYDASGGNRDPLLELKLNLDKDDLGELKYIKFIGSLKGHENISEIETFASKSIGTPTTILNGGNKIDHVLRVEFSSNAGISGPEVSLFGLTIVGGSCLDAICNGAGIDIQSSRLLNIDHCVVKDCFANTQGGALFAMNTPLKVTNSQFINNESKKGGALDWAMATVLKDQSPDLKIDNCVFDGNRSNGAIRIRAQVPALSIKNSTFKNNFPIFGDASSISIELGQRDSLEIRNNSFANDAANNLTVINAWQLSDEEKNKIVNANQGISLAQISSN
jgi:hypothetical protein